MKCPSCGLAYDGLASKCYRCHALEMARGMANQHAPRPTESQERARDFLNKRQEHDEKALVELIEAAVARGARLSASGMAEVAKLRNLARLVIESERLHDQLLRPAMRGLSANAKACLGMDPGPRMVIGEVRNGLTALKYDLKLNMIWAKRMKHHEDVRTDDAVTFNLEAWDALANETPTGNA